MTTRDWIDDLQGFVRANAVVLGAVALVTLLAYGFGLTAFALSVDEDVSFLFSWNDNWIAQGRPVIPLVQTLLRDTLPLPFFNLALALAVLFSAGTYWAFLVSRAVRPRRVSKPSLLVFLIVFTTLPVNAYYLAFNPLNVELSLAFLWSALSVTLAWWWAVEGRGWPAAGGAVVMAALAVLTYQDFAFVVIAGTLIVQVAFLLGRRRRDMLPARVAFTQTVRLLVPVVAAAVVVAIVSLLLVERGGYIESIVGWGAIDIDVSIGRIVQRIIDLLTGSGFPGGWVLLPTIAAGLLLVALVVRNGLRERQWYPLALVLLLAVMPFGLAVAVGRPLPNRAMQTLVLVAASVWLLLPLLLYTPQIRRWVGVGLLVVAVLFAVWNGGITTRSFVTEHQTWEADRATAYEIGRRLIEAGWDGQEVIPLATVGIRAQNRLERLARREFVGFSLFNGIEGRRSAGLMRLLGFPMERALDEDYAAAVARSASMPTWPATGSVVFEEGMAIVKFSEP